MVRLIGTRAKQISDGSKVFVKYDGEKSAIELAELEIKYKMLPLKIKRPLPNGKYEIWKVSELDILKDICKIMIQLKTYDIIRISNFIFQIFY